MTADPSTLPPAAHVRRTVAYVVAIAAGPAAFVALMALPLDLSYQGRVVLATFTWAVVWWITQPLPWAISAMLPFLVYPAAGVMDVVATIHLYGQPIFFWIMGTVLIGHAIEKHGLAQRFALSLLALPGIGGRTDRLVFCQMVVVGLISMFVSDATAIAMTIPVATAIARQVRAIAGVRTDVPSNFATSMTLGTFYGAVAGGTATVMGLPHNAIAISVLTRMTGRELGFFEWMRVGVPVFVCLLLTFYATIRMRLPIELRDIPGGEAYLRAEHAKLGPMRASERRVIGIFSVMVALFVLPTVATLALGESHPATVVVTRALPFWVVPPAVMFLLFTVPSGETPTASLVTWTDAERQSPWNTMLLVTGAVAMTDALTQFGFVDFVGQLVRGTGVGPTGLPYLTASIVAAITNLMSGTAAAALFCSVFVPAAVAVGYNPASIAILIANVALGLVFPWAGAASATAFAGGEISLERMIRTGLLATVLFSVVVATIHLLLAPFV